MKEIFQRIIKLKWPIGVLLLFFVFFSFVLGYQFNGTSEAADYTFICRGEEINVATYKLHRVEETFSLKSTDPGDQFAWTLDDPTLMTIQGSTNLSAVHVQVGNKAGSTGLNCLVTKSDGSTENHSLTIEVVFSINEGLTPSGDIKMDKALAKDDRNALIMNVGAPTDGGGDTLEFGNSAVNEPKKLNLVFGDASSDKATWTSDNEDVIRVNTTTKMVEAVGAGKTKLNVSYQEGTDTYKDSIEVYVRPKIYWKSDKGERIDNGVVPAVPTRKVDPENDENSDLFWVPVRSVANPNELVLDKLTWVITKGSGTQSQLVSDSLGNKGANGDDATLIYNENTSTFRLKAKAGVYSVQFYVKGTYQSFASAQQTNPKFTNCDLVSFTAEVYSKYSDKEVTLNEGGSYNLPDAFNISATTFADNFQIVQNETVLTQPGESSEYLGIDDEFTVNSIKEGSGGYVTVLFKSGATVQIPGLSPGKKVKVNINVTQGFALNAAAVKMHVGQDDVTLTGLLGNRTVSELDTFTWKTDDEDGKFLTVTQSKVKPQEAVLKAVKETDTRTPNKYVTVTLSWTDENAVTLTATCQVTIAKSITKLTLNYSELEMTTGSVDYLDTGLRGEQKLSWISANSDLVSVEAQLGNTQAKLTAGNKTGSTIITVINPENNVFATCRVTVTAAITKLTIEQGENIDVSLAEGFVFLKAVYEPKDATSTELKWTSSAPSGSDSPVADVDENGVVTLLGEGTVWITVEPVYNPNSVLARCCINVLQKPVTDIIVDVEELEMIAGDSYTVQTEIEPEDATNTTLLWNTDDDKVATVAGGVITAKAVGNANITVANGTVFKIIKVHVRNRLESIAFTDNTYKIKEGDTIALKDAVVFTPAEDINTNLSWKSTDESIVSVDKDGNITGVKAGERAWITCIPEDLGIAGAITCTIDVISDDIPANGVTLDPKKAKLYVGESLQIGSIFDPVTATYQNLSWSSTDDSVATVDQNGLVTAVSEGKVNIGAVYKDPITNTVWDPLYCEITVVKAPIIAESFKLTPMTRELYVGDNYTLIPVFTPADATNQKVTYYSSDETVATVDENGVVEGIAVGGAVLIGRAEDGAMVATCTVTVIKPPVPLTDFTVKPSEQEIAVGSTCYISPVFMPADASNQKVNYSSVDETIATVAADGLVTGVAVGKTTIICQSVEGKMIATCTITVIKPYIQVTGFTIDPIEYTLETGATFTITPIITPTDATNQKVSYESANPAVATVTENGVVNGLAKGDTTIICQSEDSKLVVYCVVHVVEGVKLKLDPKKREIALGKTFQITKQIEPIEADPAAKWTSSDDAVAQVTEEGIVKGLKKGKCNVTCKLEKYNVTAICSVTVATLRTTIKLNKVKIRMGTGATYKLKATVWTNNSKTPEIKWSTKKKKIAKVNQKGKVTSKKQGNTTIVATTRDRLKVRAKCKVKVIQRAKALRILPNYTTCYVGGTKKLTPVFTPRDTTIRGVTWTTEDPAIATVESNGMIRGIAEGETRITATSTDGSNLSATCMVKVTEHIPVSSIVVAQSALTMKKGDSTRISYTLLPSNYSDGISFASDNNRIAKVSANGKVTATGTGNCTITILADGGVSSTVAVNVVALNRTSMSMRQYDTETLAVEGLGDGSEVSWYSSNQRVATVEDGKVVGRGIGSTYIYATVDGCKMGCRVTVTRLQ